MSQAMIKDMLDNAVHIGFKRQYWSPKMREYIYGVQNDVHVFDLSKTVDLLEGAKALLADLTAKGKTVMIVGTKVQARDIVREVAEASGSFYINTKWVPGLLTNFSTLKRRIAEYVSTEEDFANGALDGLTKKERSMRMKELQKLRTAYEGVRDMKRVPDVVIVVDGRYESLALQETKKLGITTIALLGSTGDIDMTTHFVPCNVNSMKSLKYVLDLLMASVQKVKKTEPGAPAAFKKIAQKPKMESEEAETVAQDAE